MEVQLIEDQWKSFRAKCVPEDAGSEQVRATREAFYAGFASSMFFIKLIGEPEIVEERGLQILTALSLELETYIESRRPLNN